MGTRCRADETPRKPKDRLPCNEDAALHEGLGRATAEHDRA